jgi:hypothetical protein
MNTTDTFDQIDEQVLAEQKELFRYNDLEHPLIKAVFEWHLRNLENTTD